jgi:hypothetical protein
MPVSAAASRRDERSSRERARRTSASARLQACASVFVRSRIHFDPVLRVLRLAGATDCRIAPGRDDATVARAEAAERPFDAPQADAKITIH